MIDLGHPDLSVRRQCELLGLNRATFYYQAIPESAFNLDLMRMIDEQLYQDTFLRLAQDDGPSAPQGLPREP